MEADPSHGEQQQEPPTITLSSDPEDLEANSKLVPSSSFDSPAAETSSGFLEMLENEPVLGESEPVLADNELVNTGSNELEKENERLHHELLKLQRELDDAKSEVPV